MFWSSRYTLLYMVGAGIKCTALRVASFIPEHSRKGTNANPKCRILASRTQAGRTSLPKRASHTRSSGSHSAQLPAVLSYYCSCHPQVPASIPRQAALLQTQQQAEGVQGTLFTVSHMPGKDFTAMQATQPSWFVTSS